MKHLDIFSYLKSGLILILILALVGCTTPTVETSLAPAETVEPALVEPSTTTAADLASTQTTASTDEPTDSVQPEMTLEPTGVPETGAQTESADHLVDSQILYHDDFEDPASGWPEAKFDNYFIGYHEPQYYHVEIDNPQDKAPVFIPGKQSFDDGTIVVNVQTNSTRTSEEGDFIYGIAFRRSGDQYYALAISPRTKEWFLLKSSPNALVTLAQGVEGSIHDADVDDVLRVDAQGSAFSLHINDRLIAQVNDADYASGEIGFYVQTFDSSQAHIHFDELTVSQYQTPQPVLPTASILYHDDFKDPGSGWPEAKFDNYFIGYHEPQYYHVEVDNAQDKAPVFIPGKQTYDDSTILLKVQTNSTRTSEEGDFIYGLAFRRSGDQYYVLAISSRTKEWFMLKSSPSALVKLAQGVEDSIHDVDIDDVLRVDAQGSSFSLQVNDRLVAQVNDSDYASGEIGFYVQTFDSSQAHVHFDELTIAQFQAPSTCKVAVRGGRLNVRSGPGLSFAPLTSLSETDVLQPLGISPDGQWLSIRVESTGEVGWVTQSDQFVSCNMDTALLPIIIP